VLGTVNGDLAEIEPDDAVVAGQGLIDQTVEHPSLQPLVAPAPQRRFRSLAKATGHIPRAASDQPEQDRFEAVPVRKAATVTPERMLIDHHRQPRRDRCPHDVDNTRMNCEHDG